MSVVTVSPGEQVGFDPSDERVILFDFDALNLAVGAQLTNTSPFGISIDALAQASPPSLGLTFDNASLLAGNRKVQARFIASGCDLWDLYRVSVVGYTNETPAQKKEFSITIFIEQH